MKTPKAITVCSRVQAYGASHNVPWAVISIRNPVMSPLDFSCPNLKWVLHLDFDDADKPKEGMKLFTIDQAREVWDFLELIGDIDVLLIHCLMGLSRSPAIAAAIDKVTKGDDRKWFSDRNPDGMVPNRRVFQRMLQAAHERGLI